MNDTKEFEKMFRQEFGSLTSVLMWQNDDGTYEVFGHYKLAKENGLFRVYCSATDVGLFGSSKTALSWCIADNNKKYNLAREIRDLDTKYRVISDDIKIRASLADRSKNPAFRESIATKLESKIITKKIVETRLTKCVNWAKYTIQQGFKNETVRTGHNQTIKTSR